MFLTPNALCASGLFCMITVLATGLSLSVCLITLAIALWPSIFRLSVALAIFTFSFLVMILLRMGLKSGGILCSSWAEVENNSSGTRNTWGNNFNNHNNTSLAAPGALAHRLQRRTACKIQNGCQGAPKWPTGSGKGSNPRLLAALNNIPKIGFLIRGLLLAQLATWLRTHGHTDGH